MIHEIDVQRARGNVICFPQREPKPTLLENVAITAYRMVYLLQLSAAIAAVVFAVYFATVVMFSLERV